MLNIVARLHCKGGHTAGHTLFQRRNNIGECGYRIIGVLNIMTNILIIKIEIACLGIEMIAALGNGKRDNFGITVRQFGYYFLLILRRENKIDH